MNMAPAAIPADGGNPATAAPCRTDPRLQSAAHEFEACLMKEFLAPLRKDSLSGEDGDSTSGGDDGSGNALTSFGSEAFARAISERGGFGIATRILDHFKSGTASQNQTENRGAPLRSDGK